MRRKLWQRIFICTILLLTASIFLTFLLFKTIYQDDFHNFHFEATRKMAEVLRGQSVAAARANARAFDMAPKSVWILDGTSLETAGEKPPAIDGADAKARWTRDGITLVENDTGEVAVWTYTTVDFAEGKYLLVILFGPPPVIFRHAMLAQFMGAILLGSVMLAFWMAWSVSRPLRRLHDEVLEMSRTGPGYSVTVTGNDEITDLAKAVNMLTDSLTSHMRGLRDLVANVSHELRSPLTRAAVNLVIIEESLPPEYTTVRKPGDSADRATDKPALVAEYLASLHEELAHMESLISTTLLTRKLDVQKDAILTNVINLSALCEDACERYRALFARGAFTFCTGIEPGLSVMGNKILLMQLLSNLLDNCLKYTTPEGQILVSLDRRGKEAHLCVENSFDSLPPGEIQHIFDPYYQGSLHQNGQAGMGLGLGLAYVRKTAMVHGGGVAAEETHIGVRICARFPLA